MGIMERISWDGGRQGNVGRAVVGWLKGVAIALWVFSVIGAIGFLFSNDVTNGYSATSLAITTLLVGLIPGLILYSLGTLIELQRMSVNVSQVILSNQCSAPKVIPSEVESAPVKTTPEPKSVSTTEGPGIVMDAERVRCPKCGTIQPIERSCCWDCGFVFQKELPESSTSTPRDKLAPPEGSATRGEFVTNIQKNQFYEVTVKTNRTGSEFSCPLCGVTQRSDREYCRYCGAMFE